MGLYYRILEFQVTSIEEVYLITGDEIQASGTSPFPLLTGAFVLARAATKLNSIANGLLNIMERMLTTDTFFTAGVKRIQSMA